MNVLLVALVVLALVKLIEWGLNPIYTGTIYKPGDGYRQPRWNQIAAHEPVDGRTLGIYTKSKTKSTNPNALDLNEIATIERGR